MSLMAYEELPKGRARITDLGSQITIEIPTRPRNVSEWLFWCFLTGFLLLWLSGELFFCALVLQRLGLLPSLPLKAEGSEPPFLFLLGFLSAWTVVGIALSVSWLHLSLGRELITVSPDELTVAARPFGRPQKYRLSDIRNLRVLELGGGHWWLIFWWVNPFMAFTIGAITFDYGAKTVYLGSMLDPAEARQIVRLIKERFGDYMAPEG